MLQLNFLVFCLFVSLFIFDQTFTLPTGHDTPSAQLTGVTPTMNMERRNQLDDIVQGVDKIVAEDEHEHELEKRHVTDPDQKKEESVGSLEEESERKENGMEKRHESDQKTGQHTQQDSDGITFPTVEQQSTQEGKRENEMKKRHEADQKAEQSTEQESNPNKLEESHVQDMEKRHEGEHHETEEQESDQSN